MPKRVGWGLGLVLSMMFSAAITQAQDGLAEANEEQARAHFRLGRAHYDNGDFAKAAVEFEEAYRISQRPALLYNIYLAYRDANDTRKAADALRRYLVLEKTVENRGQLESKLAALDRSLQNSAPPPAAAAPAPARPAAAAGPAAPAPALAPAPAPASVTPREAPSAPEAAVAASEPDAPGKPFPVLPVALMGGGGAMAAASILTGVMATGKQSDWEASRDRCNANPDCTGPSQADEDLKSSGQTLALVTDILLFGGLAVAGTGVVLFVLDAGSPERAPASASATLACAPGQCGARVFGRF